MTMFDEGTDTATIASLRAELEMARRITATYEAANGRLVAGAADDLEQNRALRQRVAVLEKSLATAPPGWSADLDAMERATTPKDDALIAEIAKAPPREVQWRPAPERSLDLRPCPDWKDEPVGDGS